MSSDLLLDDGCGLQTFRRFEYLIEIGKFLQTAKNAVEQKKAMECSSKKAINQDDLNS